MKSDEKRKITTLCDNGWGCKGCPEIFLDDLAESSKQVSIIDDFGDTVAMSKDQFRILVQKSKNGELDI